MGRQMRAFGALRGALVGLFLVFAVFVSAEEPETGKALPEKTAPLEIEALGVEPGSPGPETLCRLSITIANRGSEPATALEIVVRIGGQELEVYRRQLFMDLLPPGESTEVRLFNFWSSESGRPAPADGKLELEVEIAGASRVELETAEDGTEIWTLGEALEGLPSSKKTVISLAGDSGQ